ncbi:1-deoxy-D-xylulose-5-phosphate synthase [Allokutzneria oryzae]|uniref:1-deoxy-D-xylulose-5-phosphate synthase n=1 Tax=Allokutzneria oryzae TaxID=1378989 RepID=A0ABV5ZYI2_9PSEU
MSSHLDTVTSLERLRELPATALPALAAEIREELISNVTRTGGHLGPNLGVVELTIALHRVFSSPRDAIVWDTGHQSYVHKMLTGRRDAFARLRQADGLSGYPSRAESEHDLVENSHASTALSYVDGLAKAFALRGEHDRAAVAVVGDGALTGGMCWEALNNIGAAPHRPLVIVLNDNGRSYSPTTGSVAAHLAVARDGGTPALFDALGLAYLGPVDGHDTAALERSLRTARALRAPVVVHCITQKGRGYPAAEDDEVDHLHALSPPGSGDAGGRPWTSITAEELVDIARQRPDVVAVTAAMLHPTGLHELARVFPERVFDVGIAEQHAVTSAAGLALGGLHPVVCLYSTFLNRAFDQVLMDVALHGLPVTFVLDRAGITGNDGASHHGMWDLSLLGLVPGIRVAAPRDEPQLRALLREAVSHSGPTALRFPKGHAGPELPARGRIGGADLLCGGRPGGVLMVVSGACVAAGLDAAARLRMTGEDVTVVDPRWLLPVDPALVAAAEAFRLVLTVEDNGCAGGYSQALNQALRAAGCTVPVHGIALPQRFLPHGTRGDLLASQGLDAAGIAAFVRAHCASRPLRRSG